MQLSNIIPASIEILMTYMLHRIYTKQFIHRQELLLDLIAFFVKQYYLQDY